MTGIFTRGTIRRQLTEIQGNKDYDSGDRKTRAKLYRNF
ncbi:hypothetical protein RintRC_6910 [Richelia intracellularis]|nr:hypothetical protein RintRC_6910 [Richelia intracellularis]